MRPMLAAPVNPTILHFPCIASPKLDGIRAIVRDGVVLSRSLKPIPNAHVQQLFGRTEYEGFDGELIVGLPYGPDVFQRTSGAVRRLTGEPDVTFHIFDLCNSPASYVERRRNLVFQLQDCPHLPISLVPELWVHSQEELDSVEEAYLRTGYEGVMLRSPLGPYKHGRSTALEGYLLKLKRFLDSEARVLAVEELMHNENEATVSELGLTKRSHHKENLVPAGTMGKLFVEDIHTGQRFHIGTGFTQAQRDEFWLYRHEAGTPAFAELVVKYKYLPVGVKDLPRHPVYLGFRDVFDL